MNVAMEIGIQSLRSHCVKKFNLVTNNPKYSLCLLLSSLPADYGLRIRVAFLANFAEICLLTNARRVASVRAETYCNLYALDRTSFQDVLQNYPFMRRTLESVAAERLHQLGRDPLQVIHRKNLKEDLEIVKEIVSQAEKEGSGFGTTSFKYVNVPKRTSDSGSLSSSKSNESRSQSNNSVWQRTFRSRLYRRKGRVRVPSSRTEKLKSDLTEADHEESEGSESDQQQIRTARQIPSSAPPRLGFTGSRPKHRFSSAKQRINRRGSRQRMRQNSGTAFRFALKNATLYGNDTLGKDPAQLEGNSNID
ncbi:unnamed protein product [Rodentolepis nana]|uniref:Cyclic nucleotide-binding domain-containing protein n=1 Tax=Rodentolepis nana TaxID=102285 RepID=A0A0R3T684_RODNA|nr:unnamed protein product [Rodentolepis nana]